MENKNMLLKINRLNSIPRYRPYFKYLRNRKRYSKSTYLDQVTHTLKKDSTEEEFKFLNGATARDFFTELNKIGLGKVSRIKSNYVFEWFCDPREVGKASMGLGDLSKVSMKDPTIEENDNVVVLDNKNEIDEYLETKTEVNINLPGLREVNILLPIDFNNNDLELVKVFLNGHLNREKGER